MDKPIKSIKQLAIDDLYRIGTPDAAVKLVPFLWDQYQDFAIYVAWHLGVLLKNPEVEEKLSKYQLKSEQTPVDELTYIWRPFEANSDSALFTITSRLAYLIIVSSTENIPQPILPVDPRTIIPISALETINSVKLPTKTDSQVDELLAESNITPELENNFKDKVNILLGYQQLGNNWTIKLSSISPRLQLDLLYRLIHVRSSSNSDWRNLKKDVQYNFAQGWHYKSILGISLILSLIVGTELFKLITNFFRNNDYNIINWFSLLSSSSIFLLIFCFWVALWQGIEERWEPRLFILFGLIGLFTFFQQLTYLWINNFVWAGINSLYNAVILKEDINHRELDSAVLVFFAIAGVGAAVLTQNLIAAVALAIVGRLALAGAILTTRVGLRGWFWGMAMIVLISLAFAVIWPWVLTNSYAALSAWILSIKKTKQRVIENFTKLVITILI